MYYNLKRKVWSWRGIKMDIFNILSIAGGLALFLFGMSLMGKGLEKVSGGKMEQILEKMTNTPIKGVLLGALVTAVIQSSSATTVMVVGFVNSGIMTLSQAIGIIMGANIGTTATGWLLSLNGLEGAGTGTFLKLLQPSSFTPILAFVGILLYMFLKSGKKKDIGTILLGFAVLMYGMSQMSSAVSGLKDMPAFVNMLTAFSNPFLALLAGTVLTMIIQSSSASIGILQALSSTGAITVGMTIPLIMGTSIGASAPCLLSSVGANKNAKRAAFVYLYFNLIGTLILLPVYYICNAIFSPAFTTAAATTFSVAMVNTVFNVLTAVILIPFTRQFEKFMHFTIPDAKDGAAKESFELLDDRFLKVPSFAIEQAKSVVARMAGISQEAMISALDILFKYDKKTAEQIAGYEDETDEYEDKLGTYLVKVSRKSMTAIESKKVSKMLHSIGDLERIADHADNMVKVAKEIAEKRIVFSEKAHKELDAITAALREIITMSVQAFINDDAQLAARVEPLEQVIDLLKDELRSRHIRRLQNSECTIENGFVFNDILMNIERVSDHCSNLAVCVIQLQNATFDTHEYLRDIKANDEEFKQLYKEYKSQYYTPIK